MEMIAKKRLTVCLLFTLSVSSCDRGEYVYRPIIDNWNRCTLDYLNDSCEDYSKFALSLKMAGIPPSQHGTNDLNEVIRELISFRMEYYPKLIEKMKASTSSTEEFELLEHFHKGRLRLRVSSVNGSVYTAVLIPESEADEITFNERASEETNDAFLPDKNGCIAIEEGIFPDSFVFVTINIRNKWSTKYAKIY